jgi:hypothetical protein
VAVLAPVRSASATPPEPAPVWRAQLRVVTGTVSDADSDDNVSVSLNGTNATFVDTPADDFERGHTDTFDLLPAGVRRFSDIQRLQIRKFGTDGWCIARVTLVVNGRPLFDAVPGSPCRWIDADDGHSPLLQWTSLRSNSTWRGYVQPPLPRRITPAEMRDRVEGYVGHAIASNALYWGHVNGAGAVEFSAGGTARSVRVDLDLAADLPLLPDPAVDVDFDLRFSCTAGQITVSTAAFHVDVSSSTVLQVITLGLIGLIDDMVANAIKNSFSGFRYTTSTGTPFCPTITVLSDGNVFFT